MILTIDIGNTFTKIAVFNTSILIEKKRLNTNSLQKEINELDRKYHFKHAIVANVGKLDIKNILVLKNINFVVLNHKTPLPFTNKYKTPSTLGVDRMALAAGAIQHYPNQNCLIIDAGSCITYDFITGQHEYLGGAISPGLNMRYKSLTHFTANLPLLKAKQEKKLIGQNTKESISVGVEKGISYEIDGFIQDFRKSYANFIIILTGGDAKHLSKSIKSSIFVRPNLLMEGLSKILVYNLNL